MIARQRPRFSSARSLTPRFSARDTRVIAARQRLKPRQRRRLRDVRWSVQWWAALTSVIAGLMSVPALIISMNALTLSQQQRADALAQRAEDNREKEQATANATNLEKTAFIRHINIWPTGGPASPAEWRWRVRNANSRPAVVYLRWQPTEAKSKTARFYLFNVAPCSEGVLGIPAPKGEISGHPTFVIATDVLAPQFWSLTGEPINSDRWESELGPYLTEIIPKGVISRILPCT